MDADSSNGDPLFPKPMMVSKVIAPLKYKRNIVRAIEEMGQVEPIEVDPRLGADEIEVEERRILMESYRNQLDTFLEALDKSKIQNASRVKIGTEEADVKRFVSDVVENKSERIREIIDRKAVISNRLSELDSILDLLAKIERLQLGNAALLQDSQHLKSFLGTVFPTQVDRYFWEIAEITDNKYYIIEEMIDAENTVMVIFIMQKDREAVETKLKTLNFNEIALPKDLDLQGIEVNDVTTERTTLKNEEETLNKELEGISKDMGSVLLAAKELVDIELQRITVEKKMRRTSTTCVMWAWIPDTRQEEFAKKMDQVTDGLATTDFRSGEFDPKFSPSYVENPEFFDGMRGLVTAFGTPGMHEIDPYPFVLFMFPILFGIMFADLGHGLILATIGFYFRQKKKKLSAPPQGLSSFVYGGANLMIVMGLTAAVFGIMMNSFFGDETILWQVGIFRTLFANTTWDFFFILEEDHGELVIERDYFMLLIFSFVLGAITILLGLSLNIYQLLKHRHSNAELYAALTLLGTYVFIILTFVLGSLGQVFVLIGAGITVIMLFGTLIIEGKAHGIDGVMLGVDHILSLMSNTFSFGRILAMNTIHFVLAWLPYLFIQMAVGDSGTIVNHSVDHWAVADSSLTLILWVVGAIIGAMIVVPVETVFSTLQALRLNWVEFFGKFYKGTGIPFRPVKIFRQYTAET